MPYQYTPGSYFPTITVPSVPAPPPVQVPTYAVGPAPLTGQQLASLSDRRNSVDQYLLRTKAEGERNQQRVQLDAAENLKDVARRYNRQQIEGTYNLGSANMALSPSAAIPLAQRIAEGQSRDSANIIRGRDNAVSEIAGRIADAERQRLGEYALIERLKALYSGNAGAFLGN